MPSVTSIDMQLVALRSQASRQSARQTADTLMEFFARLTQQLPNIQKFKSRSYQDDAIARMFATRLASHYAKQLYSLHPMSIICLRKPTLFQQLSSLSATFTEPFSLRVCAENLASLYMDEVPEALDWQTVFNSKSNSIVFSRLRQLTICHNLRSIWQGDEEEQQMFQLHFPCLETLHFIHCPQGYSFFKHIKLPPVLKRLTIQHSLSMLCMYNVSISQELKCLIGSIYDAAQENASFVKVANHLLSSKTTQTSIDFTYSSLLDGPCGKIDLASIDRELKLDALDINFSFDWQQARWLLNRLPSLRRLTIRGYEWNENECNCVDLEDMLDRMVDPIQSGLQQLDVMCDEEPTHVDKVACFTACLAIHLTNLREISVLNYIYLSLQPILERLLCQHPHIAQITTSGYSLAILDGI
ncbi:hypothetical protein BX667DRAFT_508921 [Coemansia mojavensis]|nr:hypothetical protein BX667DRAFT_508921 [Coemansia mojavensis]